MKVLVTGGAGFIGSHTCVELLNAGYEVVVIDNYSNSKPEVINRIRKITGKDLTVYDADLRCKAAVEKIFEENHIDSVIHFAGLKAVGESVSEPMRYYSHNLECTFTLLEVMKEHKVGKLVFSSSATVYGVPEKVPVTEDALVISASNPYGETKLMQERILADICAARELDVCIALRYFNPIGAHESGLIGEDPNGIPTNLLPYISKVSVGQLPQLNIYGNDYDTHDGTGVRDYIHVVDLARAHIKALERANSTAGYEFYNLGTGIGYSVLDIVNAYEKVTGTKVPYRIVSRRPGDVASCYADPSKAARILSWKAEYGIEKMCEDLYRWQVNNPEGYPTN